VSRLRDARRDPGCQRRRGELFFVSVPMRSAPLVEPLMNAWGFDFSGTAFVWVKPNKTKPGWFKGTGYTTRKNAETCWLGRRASPKRKSKNVGKIIEVPRREHSRKPDEALRAHRGVLRRAVARKRSH
jgi:N6-adenosine-specific RNA methylase IME4